jgi:hypothetical protein
LGVAAERRGGLGVGAGAVAVSGAFICATPRCLCRVNALAGAGTVLGRPPASGGNAGGEAGGRCGGRSHPQRG